MKHKKKFAKLAAAALALCLGAAPLSACLDNGGGNEGGTPTHTHSGGTATCTQKAVCTECGQPYGELATHSYGTPVVHAATCTADGYTSKTCSVCNDVQKTPIKATGHSYGTPVVHDATCTEDGSKTETCSVCNDVKSTIIEATGHNYGKTEEKATCTTDGVATYTCEACGNEYTEITAKSSGHVTKADAVWSVKTQTPDSSHSCNVHVVEATKCANCNEEITRNLDKHVPSYKATVTKAATCSQEGEIKYDCACGVEKYSYTADIPVNANAHTWVAATAKANVTHVCSGCGATKTEVAKTGTTATITADELKGENVAIAMTDSNTTLQPDAALVEKMGGAEVKVETATASSLEISNELKEQIGDSPVYDFGMTKDGQPVAFDGGKMTVTVPYTLQEGEDPTAITVLYINDKGESQEIDAVYVNGNAVFEVEHFSYYTVVRLTPAQRCAKIGHDYQDTVVKETCTTDGYTLQNCRRCGDHKTVEGKKATGHNYEANVIKPTCTEKGYTIYTCPDCEATYIGDYVDVTPHDYKDEVVAPTCTTKGYTVHTCNDCGKQYKDTYTAATGHNYTNGACSVCGAKDPSVADNFYFNLIESIDPYAGVYLDMSNITFEYTLTGMNNGGSGSNKPDEPAPAPSVKPMAEGQTAQDSENTKVKIDLYRFTFRIDENDNIEGKGEGKMTLTTITTQDGGKPETSVMDQEIKLVIKGGKVYTFSKSVQDDDTYSSYSVSPIDDGMNGQFKVMFEQVYTKELVAVLTALQGQNNSPVNGAIAKVVEYLFNKVETDNGYTFTLETDRAKELINILTTESFNTVFDRVFGDGAYKATYDWIYALPEKTVAELKTEVFGWLVKTGISEKDLYAAVNSIVNVLMPPAEGGEPFDIGALLTANGEVKVVDLLSGVTGTQMTVADLQAMIKQYGDMLSNKEIPVADLVAQLAGAQLQGSVADIVKAYDEIINSLSAALKDGLKLTFTTDKSGTFLGYKAEFTELEFTVDETVTGSGTLNVKLNGGLTLTPGGDFISDVNTIVTKLDNALKTLDITEDKKLTKYDTEYTLKKDGEYLYLIPDFNQNRVSWDKEPLMTEGTYNGVDCIVTTLKTYDSTYKLTDNSLTLQDHCTPWVEYYVNGYYSSYTTFKVYISKTGKEILGWEYDKTATEANLSTDAHYGTGLYYNPVTGEFAGKEQHKYVLVDSREAECHKGGEGFEKYRCTVCGDTYIRTTYKPHKPIESMALKGNTCEEGIIITHTCTVCKEVVDTYETEGVWKDGSHRTFESLTPIEHDGCSDLKYIENKCLCGQYTEDIFVSGRCEFDLVHEESTYCSENESRLCEHGYHNHRVEVYRCAVTACAYTYTAETYLVPTKTECVYTYHKIITLEDKTEHSMTQENYESHDYRWINNEEANIQIEKEECAYCNDVRWQTTRTYKEMTVGKETYKVLIRYEHVGEKDDNYGYEREYKDNDVCHYVEYRLENGNRVGDGVPGTDHHYSTTVTEKQTEGDVMTVTYHCQTCNETVNIEKYQVFSVTLSDGTTKQLERLISSVDEHNNGFIREYNGDCSYFEYYIENGVKSDKICGEGVEHAAYIDKDNKEEYQAPTCTQYGHYIIHCLACNKDEYVYLTERGHNYVPEENGDGYYCEYCGMHNQIEADGPVSLESEVTADSVIVGYNDRFDRENVAIEIYVNNNTDTMQLLELDFNSESHHATEIRMLDYYDLQKIYQIYDIRNFGECGVITIDKAALLQKLEELAASGLEIKDVSVSVTVSGKHMPDDQYDDYIEQSVTFTLAELVGATEEPAPTEPPVETPTDTPVEVPVETPEEKLAA